MAFDKLDIRFDTIKTFYLDNGEVGNNREVLVIDVGVNHTLNTTGVELSAYTLWKGKVLESGFTWDSEDYEKVEKAVNYSELMTYLTIVNTSIRLALKNHFEAKKIEGDLENLDDACYDTFGWMFTLTPYDLKPFAKKVWEQEQKEQQERAEIPF